MNAPSSNGVPSGLKKREREREKKTNKRGVEQRKERKKGGKEKGNTCVRTKKGERETK